MFKFRDIRDYLNYFLRLNLGLSTPFPQVIFLEATKRCYLRCEMCDIWRMDEDGSTDLTLEQLTDFFEDARQHRVRLINIYGGEPLVRKDICEVIAECTKRGVSTSLTTAGPPLTEKLAKRLGRAGLGTISVSIDSHVPSEHDRLRGREGTFEKAIRAIRLMQAHAPSTKIGVNFTIMKTNHRDLPEMVSFVDSLNISFMKLFPIHTAWPQNAMNRMNQELLFIDEEDTRQLDATIKKVRKQIKNSRMQFMSDTYLKTIPHHHLAHNPYFNRCFAAKLTCEVQANGDVLSCLERPILLGNIKDRRLSDIWKGQSARSARKELKNCKACQMCCYIEPALRYRPKFLLREPGHLLKDYRLYADGTLQADTASFNSHIARDACDSSGDDAAPGSSPASSHVSTHSTSSAIDS